MTLTVTRLSSHCTFFLKSAPAQFYLLEWFSPLKNINCPQCMSDENQSELIFNSWASRLCKIFHSRYCFTSCCCFCNLTAVGWTSPLYVLVLIWLNPKNLFFPPLPSSHLLRYSVVHLLLLVPALLLLFLPLPVSLCHGGDGRAAWYLSHLLLLPSLLLLHLCRYIACPPLPDWMHASLTRTYFSSLQQTCGCSVCFMLMCVHI